MCMHISVQMQDCVCANASGKHVIVHAEIREQLFTICSFFSPFEAVPSVSALLPYIPS